MEKKKQRELLQLPALIESVASRADGTWKVTVGTQELADDQALSIVKLNRKIGWFVFKKNPLEQADIVNIPDVVLNFKGEKSPAETQRNVIWRLWEQAGKPGSSELYYRQQMEKINDWLKGKLN